jgi:hypothetical protein
MVHLTARSGHVDRSLLTAFQGSLCSQ